LINTGRGDLIDEEAVAEALQEGYLGGFAADVLSREPPPEDNPLLSAPNTFITPHIAWATAEARQRLLDIAIANIKAFQDGAPQNQVN
jgi:glycerate dehydrogenase